MIKSLRIRLTAIFSLLTTLILSAAVLILFFIAREQYLIGAKASFNSVFSEISEKLRAGEIISDNLLLSREADGSSIIYIEDNNVALNHGNQSSERLELAKAAKAACFESGLDLSYAHSREAEKDFYFESRQNVYNCRALYMPKGKYNEKHILLLYMQEKSVQSDTIVNLALQFILLWLFVAAALCILSYVLSGFAIRPTQQAVKRQAEFTAAASHELRGPIAVIKANLSACTNKKTPPEKAAEFIAAAESEAERLARLTDDLLLLSCGDAQAIIVENASAAPDTICIELYEKYYLLSKQNKHELSVILPDNAVDNIITDKEKLTHLLGILICNALEHTPKGTKVEILLEQDGAKTVFKIADYGCGIKNEDKPFVFERFYRADKSRADKAHFGLGLCVAAQLAQALKAKLSLADTEGGGATFTVSL